MKIKIVTVGTDSLGGIKTVIDNYIETGLYKNIDHRIVTSHKYDKKSLNSLIFFVSIIKCLLFRIIGYKKFHMHMSMRGSFYRKYILTKILKCLNSNVIIHLHGSEFEEFYIKSNVKTKKHIKDLFLIADTTIVLSNSWKKIICRIQPASNVVVINNFVKEIPKVETEKTNKTIFLFMGEIGDRKGIYDLLHAIKKLSFKRSDFKVIIGGKGEIKKLNKLINKLSINEYVKYEGWIVNDRKNYLINYSNVIILPSYNEGLPMVIAEAFSNEKTVIMSNVGGIPEIVHHGVNGYLIHAGNIEEITNSMNMCCNKTITIELGIAGRDSYEKFLSPETVIPKLLEVYESYEKN